ncbi:alpha/beta hydrolase [Phaeobacter sp.]|uniref:alpha/beta hydrolase n=1 Tax=Phaeobacter sp. TaxID=1902409 RepID=UPI003458E933
MLLVHGSCHGAWCWRDLVPALAAQGVSAETVDLLGHGATQTAQTDLSQITLQDTAAALRAAVGEKTIVLGHSWGGYPISAAADLGVPMRGLIYLCAYVPKPGKSMIDMRKDGPRQTLTGKTVKSADGASYRFDTEHAADLLFHDCPAEVADYGVPRLCAQAIRPQDTVLELGTQWANTPKAYIQCTQDRVIPLEYQAQMVADWPENSVHALHSSHSPFFSQPARLAEKIAQIMEDM